MHVKANIVKLIGKYNLNVGLKVNEQKFFEGKTNYNEGYNEALDYCEKFSDCYEVDYVYADGKYNFFSLRAEEITGDTLQHSTAIGAHGTVPGQPLFPQIGVVKLYYSSWSPDYQEAKTNGTIYNGGYIDLDYNHIYTEGVPYMPSDAEVISVDVGTHLRNYKTNLEKFGVEIGKVTIPSVSDLNELTKDVTGDYLPLQNWWDNLWEYDYNQFHYRVGSIKEILPTKYSWVYNTTYWTRTVDPTEYDYQYFVDTLGDLCSGGTCPSSVGAGLRPVVTITHDTAKELIK